jgi:NAD(P)H-dependent FMN reductase
MPPLIQLVIGSTRASRFADKPLVWLLDRLGAREDLTVEVVDLRDHPLPFFDQPLAPARAPRRYATPAIARLGQTFDRADGFLVLTGEYNHGYPAVLKNALDHYLAEFARKPISFVAYGNTGGARGVEQLRLVAVELELAPLRHAVHILPDVLLPAIRSDPDPELFVTLDVRLHLAVTDLVWWATALTAARNLAKKESP